MGVKWDMALGFQDAGMEVDGWLELIRAIIRQYSFALDSLQITCEANLTFMEGSKPNVQNALVQGIIAAKEAAEAANAQVKIGFAAVPDHFGPVVPEFWESIFQLGGRTFVESLDYVGYNFYADVFEASLT